MGLFNRTKDEPEATLPVNDAERWIAGTYAIWSEYCGGSYKYLGGYEKTKSNAKMISRVLRGDWMVKDHDSGVEMIEYLLKNAGSKDGAEDTSVDTTAFDYACACNMCGRMFISGYFTREESIRYATEAARKIQEKYHSWEEYFKSYIIGAAGGSNIKEIAPFETAYKQFRENPDSPLQLAWDTRL